MYAVRDEYATRFGRQVLTVWAGPFASQYEAEAVALPRGGGFMLRTFTGRKVRVTCEAPRTNRNYEAVDAAISAALHSTVTDIRICGIG